MPKRHRNALTVVVMLIGALADSPAASAGPAGRLAKSAGRSLIARMLRRDFRRDAATRITRLGSPRTVYRYVHTARTVRGATALFARGTHFTNRAPRGRPMLAVTAARTYGLPARPDSRLTVRLPRGTPVRMNRVIGGAPGRGELSLASRQRLPLVRKQLLK